MKIDQKQQRAINIALVSIAFIGVVVSVLAYLENKKHAKIKEEVAQLDKEIKTLELALKEKEAKKSGIV